MIPTPSPRPAPVPRPSTIGGYKVLEEIGRGAQGVVYLGQDASGQSVAIKALGAEHAPDSSAADRLRQEGEFLSLLTHPHIAKVYGPVEDAQRLYMVMEFIEGQPLSDRLRFGPLARNEGLDVCRQIALAMEAAHVAQVVHRDLKPSNVRITPDGVVKVLDFGVAVHAGAAGPGHVVGTYGYMAPEQMMGGQVDHRADIWAFGCVLFECLVGHPLFPAASFEQAFIRVAARDADLSRLPADLPRRLREMLRACLVRHPGERLSNLAEAVAVIDGVLSRRLPAGQRPAERTNLPRRPNAFVGRERELSHLASLLRASPGVCITGPGGCGKTRLAQEAGARLLREFRDGVWFLDLSERSADEPVTGALRGAVPGAVLSRRPLPGAPPADAPDEVALAHQIGSLQVLLVIDQGDLFAPSLASLARAIAERCPHARLLITSRERVDADGHAVMALTPLDVPPAAHFTHPRSLEHLLRVESVRLFVERARSVERSYAPSEADAKAIAELCRRVEGLPLAVELAGVRVGAMRPAEILEHLDQLMQEPAPQLGTARPRHATLDACIRSSFDVLGEMEQRILERVSVFRGGWTLEAARAVCAGVEPVATPEDVRVYLTRLVNKSLISYDAQTGRYSMLESVKGFVTDRLGAGVLDGLRAAHFRFFMGFAARTHKQIYEGEQVRGLRLMTADYDNLRAALDAYGVPGVTPEDVLKLAIQIHRYVYMRGYYQEGRRLLIRALDRCPDAPAMLRCQVHNGLGTMAFGEDDFEGALREYEKALRITEVDGTKVHQLTCNINIAMVHTTRGQWAQADAVYVRCEELARGSVYDTTRWKLQYCYHHIRKGEYERAGELAREAFAGVQDSVDNKLKAVALHNMGEAAYFLGRDEEAMKCFIRSIRLKDEIEDRRGLSLSVYMYALAALRQGFAAQAAALMAKSLEIRTELGIGSLPMPKEDHDGAIRQIVTALGADGFAAAWNRGRELYDEEAVQTITSGASLA